MGWDGHMVARLQMNRLGFPFKQQLGFPFKQNHPFLFVLIVPKVFGASVSRGHNAFDANVLALYDCFDKFYGEPGWKRGKKVRCQSFAFLARQHIDGLRSFPCLDRSAIKVCFTKRQRDDVVFATSRARE
jgi:hypothetical protein